MMHKIQMLFRLFIACGLYLFANFVVLHAHAADSGRIADPVQTLIPAGELHSGGFGALVVKVGAINGETATLFGARGGWVVNRTFVIGVGGYGYTNMMYPNQSTSIDTDVRYPGVSFGYGGLELEYLISSNNVVHASIITLIGAGGFTVVDRSIMNMWRNYKPVYSTACFVFEPAVNVEVNILTWMRFSAGVGYRFVTGFDATVGNTSYNNSTVSGLFGVGTLKFGPY